MARRIRGAGDLAGSGKCVAGTRPTDSLALGIARHLRVARLEAGLTQQQLAGDRYTKAYVSALENARIMPSLRALNFFAVRLGTTVGSLVDGTK